MLQPTWLLLGAMTIQTPAPEPQSSWESLQLDSSFTCEGASFGDLDHDGAMDLVIGPWWYAGPDYSSRHELYAPAPFDPAGYSDHFFSWTYDVDRDGRLDVVMVGFPGQQSEWFQNPGEGAATQHWRRHLIAPTVDNEAPAFTDLTGDGRPELVFHTGGVLGWAEPDAEHPLEPWIFHSLSEQGTWQRFTHGLGVGDLNGDGRADLLLREGWWEQPASLAGDPLWAFHPVTFSAGQGGAQMLVFDVDGDGDADVFTSLNAHGYGLSWFENLGSASSFAEHRLWSDDGSAPQGELAISELHALALADVNADGLPDVVTGKRIWSHGTREHGASDPAYLVWLELVRGAQGVRFETHVIHDDSGVGTQVSVGDANGDGLVDVVVGNKKGAFLHLRQSGALALESRLAQQRVEAGVAEASHTGVFHTGLPDSLRPGAQPEDERLAGGIAPLGADGQPLNLDFEAGTLADWSITGEAFAGQPIQGDAVAARRSDMHSAHVGEYWIGGYELHGDEAKGSMHSLAFELSAPWVSFWVGGGASAALRVELVRERDDKVLIGTSGGNDEALRPVRFDLTPYVGERVYLRLVDDTSGGWGHLNFDHFRMHATQPEFPGGVAEPFVFDQVMFAGQAPEDAARSMSVPDGFHVDLVAAEPDVHQPVALAIDERGRLWVAEAHSYPLKRPAGEGHDKILIFDDLDGDGRFETSQVFIEGLNLVSGLEVGYGGVWIGQAPELLFVPDRDGDDVPDGPPEVLLDGWGYQDTHETLNAFKWGPDGWLYGCHGVFTHSRVGKPGTPDAERVPINAGIWRYHPTRHEFEVFAWGTSNPWGVDFDEHGQAFITACVIPHLYHMIQGGRFIRQAGTDFHPYPYFEIDTIADHRHYLGSTPHGGNGRSSSAGGGHAHCGALLYLGDQFPAEYRGGLLFNNVHGNRVNRDVFERSGSGFVGKHADDFLLANDSWFRGINLQLAPDGCVYFIDWSDPRACHSSTPEVWDRTNGRIFRVRYGEQPPARPGSLAQLGDPALVEAQVSGDEATARLARRLMAERGPSADLRRGLFELLVGADDSAHRLRALWCLHGIGELDENTLLTQLESEDEYLRSWSIQLMLEREEVSIPALDQLVRHARTDESAVVRLYLASALQRMPVDSRWELAEALLEHGEDADDHNIPTLLWYGIEPLVGADAERAIELAGRARIEVLCSSIWRRAASEEGSRAAALRALTKLEGDAERSRALDAIWTALADRRGLEMPTAWNETYDKLQKSADEHVRSRTLGISALFGYRPAFPRLREMLADSGTELSQRELALDSLVSGKDPEVAPILQRLLDEPALCSESIRALAQLDDAGTPRVLLAKYSALSEDDRANAISALSTRASFARELLDAVGRGEVTRADLTAVTLRQLRAFEDEGIDARIAEVWGVFRETAESKAAEMAAWIEKLDKQRLAGADLSRGRDVFARTCMRCHTLYGAGAAVGPDLTGSNRADLEYLLSNILDPSAIVPLEYRATLVRTADGRVLTGILESETADSLTLKTEYDKVVVDREEIDAMRLEEQSMMPEGQLATLSEDEVVDLVAYLAHDAQVPRLLTRETQESFFDGQSLAGWSGDEGLWSVEDGTLVGRSPGLAQNNFLASDVALKDFRLVLSVKLVPNAGNSGIQFRSWLAEDGALAGYQADVGVGWWGKLYDEQGRGTLHDGAAESAVSSDDWNTYEILALGSHVWTAINGTPSVDFEDTQLRGSGVIGFQLHSGGAFEVRYRILELELDPQPGLKTVH